MTGLAKASIEGHSHLSRPDKEVGPRLARDLDGDLDLDQGLGTAHLSNKCAIGKFDVKKKVGMAATFRVGMRLDRVDRQANEACFRNKVPAASPPIEFVSGQRWARRMDSAECPGRGAKHSHEPRRCPCRKRQEPWKPRPSLPTGASTGISGELRQGHTELISTSCRRQQHQSSIADLSKPPHLTQSPF